MRKNASINPQIPDRQIFLEALFASKSREFNLSMHLGKSLRFCQKKCPDREGRRLYLTLSHESLGGDLMKVPFFPQLEYYLGCIVESDPQEAQKIGIRLERFGRKLQRWVNEKKKEDQALAAKRASQFSG